jgi:hypothetical protein
MIILSIYYGVSKILFIHFEMSEINLTISTIIGINIKMLIVNFFFFFFFNINDVVKYNLLFSK